LPFLGDQPKASSERGVELDGKMRELELALARSVAASAAPSSALPQSCGIWFYPTVLRDTTAKNLSLSTQRKRSSALGQTLAR
jgi:hypothetical protein